MWPPGGTPGAWLQRVLAYHDGGKRGVPAHDPGDVGDLYNPWGAWCSVCVCGGGGARMHVAAAAPRSRAQREARARTRLVASP